MAAVYVTAVLAEARSARVAGVVGGCCRRWLLGGGGGWSGSNRAAFSIVARRCYNNRNWLRRDPIRVLSAEEAAAAAAEGGRGGGRRGRRPMPTQRPVVGGPASPGQQEGRPLFEEKEKPSWAIQGETLEDGTHENDGDDGRGLSKLDVPHYIKLADKSPAVFTKAIAIAKSRKEREKQGKVVLEGRRLIQDALEAGAELDSVFFSKEENLEGLPLAEIPGLKLYKVMYKAMSVWSDLTTCPGIMAIFKRPDYSKLNMRSEWQIPLTVICDNIREPGNLGAVLRCAAAAGTKSILLTKGCVDVWESKVLRSACGAHFRVRVENNLGWEYMDNYLPDEFHLYLAAANSPDAAAAAAMADTTPEVTADDDDDHDEPGSFYEVSESGQIVRPLVNAMKTAAGQQQQHQGHVALPTMPYYEADLGLRCDGRSSSSKPHIALVIGGETEGLSDAAVAFAHAHGGRVVSIPLGNRIESLNTAVATGILLFEIQRQFLVAATHGKMPNATIPL